MKWEQHGRVAPTADLCLSPSPPPLPRALPQVWRYYLVPVVSEEPETQLSFDEIYVLDGKAASLARCEVHNLAPPDTPPEDLRLRIRCVAGRGGRLRGCLTEGAQPA